jgi:hypothetical protein
VLSFTKRNISKRALDDNKYIAPISMDLSKAFDCLPHNLLLLKLEAYGLTKQSLNLIESVIFFSYKGDT